ncbi:MAG: DUF2764 family protein [Bacteroidales bacterium]|nr:DUF2764 domain-containing protein [Bacteroidales bacterium]MDD2425438.1 DUF2764 family protein [Bacteroidales bacterium]MDD3988893.1 DUF2764 family protein [Bacteroidales bacterium]MDD4639295.1 DUF2764 family protein [Bacteroidales bacterium]
MMNNYYYIIAGLPVLDLDYQSRNFSLESFTGQILPHLGNKDKRLVEWLLFGLNAENLTSHFYRSVKKSKSRFLREYFSFDLILRNILTADTALKTKQDSSQFIFGLGEQGEKIGKSVSSLSAFASEYEFGPKLLQILENRNIIEREQAIDLLRWERADIICTYNYFDIEVILSFILKSALVERWAKLDRTAGEKMFRQLVADIKGSGKLNKEDQ